MAAKKETYAEAIKRLEGIVARIESNELDIDQLGENLKEAQKLIAFAVTSCIRQIPKSKRC